MDYVTIRYSNLTAENLNIISQSLSLKPLDDNYISHIKEQIKCFLAVLPYPNIDAWFNKVINEINHHPENREMFICLSNNDGSPSVLGLVILKKHIARRKFVRLKLMSDIKEKALVLHLFLRHLIF
jgi:hypothetical protein